MTSWLVHLSLISGIGPATIQRIIDAFNRNGSLPLYDLSQEDFIERCGLTFSQASKIVKGLSDYIALERELDLAEKHGITILTLNDETYPENLRHIHFPPPVLYCKGTINQRQKGIAVVGSRKAGSYAHVALEMIIPSLVQSGWCIVSGGARGADTLAHQMTLHSGGFTYAVLGSGLLCPYPNENRKLFEAIAATGAVISPFTLNQQPLPGNFPARNRIIAGLSRGCLVVQAAEQSGASITASYALEQGKDVFVIPGRIDDPLQAGSHRLIQQGAKLITSAQDILEEFNEAVLHKERMQRGDAIGEVKIQQLASQDPLLALCVKPISTEELMLITNLSSVELHEKLFNLQIDGKIEQNYAGLWQQL